MPETLIKSGQTTPAEGSENLRPRDFEPNAATGANTAGNGAICSCGATEHSAKSPDRCINGHLLRGNRAAAITGEHGAQFWREHNAELDAIASEIARDAGYLSFTA